MIFNPLPRKKKLALISFTVESKRFGSVRDGYHIALGGTFTAEEGMTWSQWVKSKYNTAGYSVRTTGSSTTKNTITTSTWTGEQSLIKYRSYIIRNETESDNAVRAAHAILADHVYTQASGTN